MRISDWSADVCSSDLAAERQVGEIEPLLGAELRDRRRQPVEQFALCIDEAAVRAALGLEFLNVDRIARDPDHAAALGLQRPVDDAHDPPPRWERSRVGKECIRTFRYRGSPLN